MFERSRQFWSSIPNVSFQPSYDVQSYKTFKSAAHLGRGEIPYFAPNACIEPPIFLEDSGSEPNRAIWVQSGCPESIVADYLAWALGLTVRSLPTLLDIPDAAAGFLITSSDNLTDRVLDRLLAGLSHDLRNARPWAAIARMGLITGRNLAAVSWMAAKVVASTRCCDERVHVSRSLSLIQPHDDRNIVSSIRIGGAKRALPAERGEPSVSPDAAVVAILTHGSESCAKGAEGIVFCGRNSVPSAISDHTEGVLACARTNICPRGPRPTPIATLADVVLMSACNGLRLADSINHPDFNFGLSFVDGPGLAYVSSVTSTAGPGPATIAFLASLADGANIAEAVISANAVALLAGIDDPSFLTIGNAFYHPVSNRQVVAPLLVADLATEMDAGDSHTAVLHVFDPTLINQLQNSNLLVSVEPVGSEVLPVCVARLTTADDGEIRAEIRIFSFPEPLGRLRVVGHDRACVIDDAKTILAAFDRWTALWRRLRLDEISPETFNDLKQTRSDVETTLSEKIPQLGWAGRYKDAISDQIELCHQFLNLIASETVENLDGKLAGSFWLTNQLAADYVFLESREHVCPQCRQPARLRRLGQVLSDVERHVVVCPRCGIVFDGASNGGVTAIALDIERPARPGEDLIVHVSIESRRSQTAYIGLGLTMPGQANHRFEPSIDALELQSGGVTRMIARCRLDPCIAPHRYYVKVLVATTDDLVFASAPFFVLPNEEP